MTQDIAGRVARAERLMAILEREHDGIFKELATCKDEAERARLTAEWTRLGVRIAEVAVAALEPFRTIK
jgi:hypothetical protein